MSEATKQKTEQEQEEMKRKMIGKSIVKRFFKNEEELNNKRDFIRDLISEKNKEDYIINIEQADKHEYFMNVDQLKRLLISLAGDDRKNYIYTEVINTKDNSIELEYAVDNDIKAVLDCDIKYLKEVGMQQAVNKNLKDRYYDPETKKDMSFSELADVIQLLELSAEEIIESTRDQWAGDKVRTFTGGLAQIEEMRKAVPADFVLPGLAIRKCGILGGDSGIGKSFIGLKLAIMVAAPKFDIDNIRLNYSDWTAREKGGDVLYFSGEESFDEVGERLGKIVKKEVENGSISQEEATKIIASIHIDDLTNEIVNVVDGKTLTATEHYYYTVNVIKKYMPRLVIIDTLSKIHGLNETDNIHMSKLIGLYQSVATKYNTSIIFVHHLNKAGAEENKSSSIRGASSIVGNSRWTGILRIMSEKEAEALGISESIYARRQFVKVEVTKASYGAAVQPVWLERQEDGTFESVDDLGEMISKNLDGGGDFTGRINLSEVRERILSGGGSNHEEIIKKRPLSKNRETFGNDLIEVMEADLKNRR